MLWNIARLAEERRRHKEALRHLLHALRVADRRGNPLDRGGLLTEVARAHLGAGNLEEAEHFGQQAREVARDHDPVEVAEAQAILARIRMRRKDLTGAAQMMREALAIFKERGMQAKLTQTARESGLMIKEEGALAEAADFLAIALETA